MKKPSRKSKPHRGSRKEQARKAARQARRASIVACDHRSATVPSAPLRDRAAAGLIPLFGLDLTRPVLPAMLGLARASARRPHQVLRRALQSSIVPHAWARAIQLPAFEDREAFALMSLPLIALSLMLALGLIELGRHRHPMYRGLEIASAARPTALPRTKAPAVPFVAGRAPSMLAPVSGVAVIAAERSPQSIADSLDHPALAVEAPAAETPAVIASHIVALMQAPMIAKSRLAAPVVPSNEDHPAELPGAVATASLAPASPAAHLATEDTAPLPRLAAAALALPEPAYPAPRAAEPIAPPLPISDTANPPFQLAVRLDTPHYAPAAPQSEPLSGSALRLTMLDPQGPGEDAVLPSPLLASLYSRYEPGSGPELCEANPSSPRPVRQTLAPAAFGQALADAAQGQTADLVIYNDTYRHLSYPWGDVSPLYGVCTDVVIRAYRALGVDLQQLVHESALGSGDTSIEHRRVETLRRFLARFGESLPITSVGEDYLPGDIVTYNRPQNRHSRSHIAVVSNEVGPSGRYKIIHNRGWGPQAEDALFVDEITGHYRYWSPAATPAPALTVAQARPAPSLPSGLLRTATSRLRADGQPARGLGH